MSLTPFPYGVSSFGIPVIGSGDIPVSTGSYFFVSSGIGVDNSGTGYGNDPARPVATIDYAIGLCTANKGDVIVVMPGHTETIAAASGITADIAGITIVGLGTGSLRPTITWSATASTFVISAANVTLKNVVCTISIDEVVSMFTISGANCQLIGVDVQPYGALGATGQAIQFAIVTGNYFLMAHCKHYQYTAAAANQVWIDLNGVTAPRLYNNTAMILAKADTASHFIGTTAACKEIEIVGNRIIFAGATITGVITCTTATTGLIADNRIGSGSAVVTAAAIVADNCYFFENYWIDAINKCGKLAPAVGTST